MYQALCSVLVQSTTLTSLRTTTFDYDSVSDTKWRWLVYALFSHASRTSVCIVNTYTKPLLPTRESVDVASVINARFPHTQLLADSSSAHDINFGMVRLATNTVIHFSSDPLDHIILHEESIFEIIRDDPSAAMLDVLAPGYGPGKVARDVAQDRAQRDITATEEGWLNHLSNVKHLYFNDNESIRNAALVLPLIGDRLKSLRLLPLAKATSTSSSSSTTAQTLKASSSMNSASSLSNQSSTN